MALKVTSVIPCHNHEKWVVHAIKSVVLQNYENLSIVVIDDGSSDNSFEQVENLIDLDRVSGNEIVGKISFDGIYRNICLKRFEKAGGPSFARNRGMELAKLYTPDIYAFLDSDDIYEQGKVSKSVEIFEKHHNHIGAVYSDYDTLRYDGLRLREYKEPFSRNRLLRECIVNCDSLVSAKAIEECGNFDESLRVCEDYDLWLRMSEKFVLFHIPESLVTIRVGQHSSTNNVAKETWERSWHRIMQKTKERANAKK